jgi:hypothetical protein
MIQGMLKPMIEFPSSYIVSVLSVHEASNAIYTGAIGSVGESYFV